MKHTTTLGILLLLVATPPVIAQESGGLKPPPIEGVLEGLREAQDPQQEILDLFRSVEKRLHSIDELLSDASAGRTDKLATVGESGLSDLIKRSRESSRIAVEEIDRILELINEPPP